MKNKRKYNYANRLCSAIFAIVLSIMMCCTVFASATTVYAEDAGTQGDDSAASFDVPEDTNTNTDIDKESDTNTDTDTDTDTKTDAGTDADTDTGADAKTDAGTDADTNPGTDTNIANDTDTASDSDDSITKDNPNPEKTAEYVYIDGVNGSDDGDGTKEHPVKTFGRAKDILESKDDAKAIIVLNKVTVKDDEEWSLPEGAQLERDKDYKGVLIEVASGASLTIKDITIDGSAEAGVTGSDSLIKVYGELTVQEGSLLQNNDIGTKTGTATLIDVSGKANIEGGTLKGGEISGGGSGALKIRSRAEVNMTGGIIRDTQVTVGTATSSRADRHDTGAVLVGSNAVFNMSGGSIEDNISRAKLMSSTATTTNPQFSSGGIVLDYYATANISGDAVLKNNESVVGGAVYMEYKSTLNISGGTFEGNHANKLGGAIIVADKTAVLNITGGTFKENEAKGAGGAIWSWSTGMSVTGGKFYNNKAVDYGGAIGLAEDNTAFLKLQNAIIRNNTARLAGGGVWVCPTGGVVFDGREGVAIYDNTAGGAGDDFASTPALAFLNYRPIRTFGVYLSDTTLADQRVAWYKDGAVTYGALGLCGVNESVPRYDAENPGERLYALTGNKDGLALKSVISDNSRTLFDSIAYDDNIVLFEGNTAVRGGAIGGNSNIVNTEDYNSYKDEELRITKKWAEDIAEEDIPDEITVKLLLDGKEIDSLVIKKENNWEGRFNGLLKEYLEAGRYSIKEVEIAGFVAKCSDIAYAGDTETTENAEETEEDLSHVWTATVENSKPTKVEGEYEPPKKEEKVEVRGEYEDDKEKEETKVKSASTGDDSNIAIMASLLLAAISALTVSFILRRRNRIDR